jgi:hypothetical protein
MSDRIPFYRPGGKRHGNAAEAERVRFYSSKAWRTLRAAQLGRHPLCEECEKAGEVVEATTVHHAQERLQRPDLAFVASNLVSLCAHHHTLHHKGAKR